VGTRWVRAEPEIVAILRHELADELRADRVAPNVVDDAVLVVSELVGNSIRHARALPAGNLAVSWEQRAGGLTISVTDGGGLQSPVVRDAGPYDTHGRGLSIVAVLTDFWGVSHGPDTVTVWAHVPARSVAPTEPLIPA
jgi:anti-sigma regulatory factor (Ser/Thr protein kinase)